MGTDITIEVLYGEFANLFGELQNVNYLKDCMPEATVIYTGLYDKPAFTEGRANLVYMGAMTENQQELAIQALKPYKKELEEQIEAGTVFLFTGNAVEIVEQYIENEDGSRIEGLGIFNTYAKRDMMHRYHSLVFGQYEDIKLVGFKAQFSHSYGDNSKDYFYDSRGWFSSGNKTRRFEEKEFLCNIYSWTISYYESVVCEISDAITWYKRTGSCV